MKKYQFLLALLVLFTIFLELAEGRRKRLRIGRKIKKIFAKKHHHKKKQAAPPPPPPPPPALTTSTSTSTSVSSLLPTATTFTTSFTPTAILLTITDRNYNYFYGYPTNSAGIDYYNSPRFLIARPPHGGCGCGNKIIIVTRAPDERLI